MIKNKQTTRKMLTLSAVLVIAGMAQADGQTKTPVYSWTNLPTAQLPVIKGDTFNIVQYGAIAKPGFINTAGITTAIDMCNSHGGGTVLIPEGRWTTGPIRLKSNVNLCLQKGAVLEFSKDKNVYPLVTGNFEGATTVRNQPPISGEDLENIAITGEGVVEGNGDVWRPLSKDKQTDAQWEQKINSGGVLSDDSKTWFPSLQSKRGQQMYKAGEIEKLKTIADFTPIKDYLRPNLVVLTRCRKILLQGVTFQNSPAWCLHPLMCSELTVQHVKVNNPAWAQNGDGLDIESCRNVVVENNSFECGDDGICIKSGKDEQGRLRAMPTENVTIRNDTVYHAHGGFVIGSEMSGGARNLFVYDCLFIGTDKGLRFKTARGRGGVVSDIYVKNIRMKDIVQEAIYFDMYYFAKAPRPGEKIPVVAINEGTPQFRDFYISDIKCEGAQKGVFVRGLPEMSITNINLSNLDLRVNTGVEIIEAKDIHLYNITVAAKQSNPVIFIANSNNVDFKQLTVPPNSNTLFSISGERTKNITASDVKAPGVETMAKFDDHAEKNVLLLN
ncbi:MAG TPA: glycoside hydrolase family 28 protein [Chitinophagaceae bacterium]